MKSVVAGLIAVLFLCVTAGFAAKGGSGAARQTVIVCPPEASAAESLAALEARRYLYLRTGRLLNVVKGEEALPANAHALVIAQKDRPLVAALALDSSLNSSLAELKAQQYAIKTVQRDGRRIVLIIGGDPYGTLYGAYRFAEILGVRFFLHGDAIPDQKIPLQLPVVDERGKPLFETRGIQPFHDFPEGPDWWNLDDYKAILSQLPKLRMNFIGLHTYPEGGPNAEPTVWIGLARDAGKDGRVKYSYPSSWQNTLRGNWGYALKYTSDFSCGASQLFERDAFGADVMKSFCPQPQSPEDCNEMFRRAGKMLREAFTYAHTLGIKTCVGTETPLVIPKRVRERLKALGKTTDTATLQEVYEGIFTRIAQTYPLDYYWFWTPEGWTWQGASGPLVKRTITDIQTALAAAKKVGAPFTLATCGWVLGPQDDRAMFDRVLPKDLPLSCINRQVGKEPVDPAFEHVTGRPKWAIPWLEDDPALTAPQLWVGRMRRDAADALAYGCTGLLGIHWRTRVLGPNVLALARAAWDQSGWNQGPRAEASGPVGGNVAAFPGNVIQDTEDQPLYRTVRYDVSAYRLKVPNGTYTVTLKFCEPHYDAKGKRVFDVTVQARKVITNLDIFDRVGKNRALDYRFDNVAVTDGWLNIQFGKRVEYPSIAAIAVEGRGFSLRLNCGGPAYKDYLADPSPAPRDLPAADFYRDWAEHQFGREAAPRIAAIFEKIDGKFPCPANWVGGPGGINPDPRPWAAVEKEYAFVDELAALRPQLRGAGSLERFDYWLNTFRYTRAMGRLNCVRAQYDAALKKVMAEKDPKSRARLAKETALPLRIQMVRLVSELYGHLLATVGNPGELGTVANWEQHLLPGLLEKPGAQLEKLLGEKLPADARLSTEYEGPTRVIVPTVRTCVGAGEDLALKVLILASAPPRDVALYWRPLGTGAFHKVPLVHVSRGVYSVEFPRGAIQDAGIEYYVRVGAAGDDAVYFPATAPSLNQTVVVMK